VVKRSMRVRLAERLSRIPYPALYSLPDFGITPSLPQLISFSPLELPRQESVASLAEPPLFDSIKMLEMPIIGSPIIAIGDGAATSGLGTPEIETLFEPIRRPLVAGKAYQDQDEIAKEQTPRVRTREKIDLTARCRHGLPKALCEVCRQATQRARERRPQTVDVFEQLRYVLQPPILERLGQPDVFPEGRKPYDFQIFGIRWLLDHPKALLADEMGLGKTIQAIIAMRILFRRGVVQRVLIVRPKSMGAAWPREIHAWAPELAPLTIQGSAQVRAEQWRTPADVHIVSPETLARDISGLPSRNFDLCIVDEAQKIKNYDAGRSKAVRQINAKFRWALTGTPLENKVDDVISIFSFVDPAAFSGREAPSAATVRRIIQPYTLRRTMREANLDLPELTRPVRWLELTKSQRAEYDRAEQTGVDDLRKRGENASRVHVFALITRLKLICNYDDGSEESCKLDFLEEELAKLSEIGEKALVFSQYPNMTLRKIMPRLERFSPRLYEGSLTDKERIRIVDNFQTDEKDRVLLMGVGSGGLGITLTRANHVFHFDHWWNPAVVDQATGRVYRIGQHRPVFANSLYTSDTIEERIADLLNKKRELFRDVFGELEDTQVGERLSDEDLFGLFDLPVPGRAQASGAIELTPTEFEDLVQRLFTALGYNVSVTKRSHDGGIDLEGASSGFGGGRVVVQCKRYAGTVGVAVVRELLGVMSHDASIVQGFLVTTGKFSREARDFAQGQRTRLIDGIELEMLIEKYGVRQA